MTVRVTPDDLERIRTIATMRTIRTVSVQQCPTGALVDYVDADRSVIPNALSAAGYTVTHIDHGLLLVSGVVDRAEILDAEIRRLTEQRDRLRDTAE